MAGLSLFVSEVGSLEGFGLMREEWNDVVRRSRSPSIFHTWEWMARWWAVFGEEHSLRVVCVRDGQRLVGLWPLYERGTSSGIASRRRLEYLGTGEPESEEVATEYADILADTSCERDVVAALWRHATEGNWDQIYMPKALANSCFVELFLPLVSGAKTINSTTASVGQRYYVELPPTWDAYLEVLGKRKRKRIQNYRRRLVREGDYQQRIVSRPEELNAAFDGLARLHEVRWASRGKAGAFASSRFRAFHRELIEVLLGQGTLDLRVWSYGGKDVAALYGFRFGHTLSYYQSGFDTSTTGSVSLGLVAVMDTIEWAIENGFQRFDFMGGGDASYKEDYECDTVGMVNVTLYNTTIRGIFGYVNRTARDIAREAMTRFRSTPPGSVAPEKAD